MRKEIFNFPAPTPPSKKTVVYYFPTLIAGEVKKAEFFAANQIFGLIPLRSSNTDFDGAFGQYNPDTADYIGTLGLPIYGSIIFGNVDIHDKSGNTYTGIDGVQYSFNNLQVDSCLITCEQPTSIVEAKITGRPGRVKEYIGLDDWNVTITLIFDNATDQAPKDFISNIWQVKQAQVAIPVTNYYLQLLGIGFIVIKDISLPQEMGKYSSQTVTITAASDIPLSDFLP